MGKFCDTCSAIFQGEREFGKKYIFSSRFTETQDCQLCNMLVTSAAARLDALIKVEDEEQPVDYVWSVYRKFLKSVDMMHFEVRNNAPRSRINYPIDFIRTSLAPKTPKRTAWQIALDWIRQCDEEHVLCKRQVGMPLRVLDVQSDHIRLREDVVGERYASLSHCWGPNPKFYMLKQGTLAEFCSGVPIEKLSATFQDAIGATRQLGLCYLWIDALCIVQDSREDWMTHAPQMASIYSQSYVNFAATDSADSNGGFYRQRGVVEPFQAKIDWKGIVADDYSCYLTDPWTRYMNSMPIMVRAWIFQERILSRTLHFAADQLLWECNELTASETFPEGSPFVTNNFYPGILNGRLKHDFSKLSKGQQGGFDQVWEAIVNQYTGLSLTKETDKLMALSGVASFLRPDADARYLAGLWSSNLELSLLWNCTGHGRRPETYQAPSWSWASLIGSVSAGNPTGEDFETIRLEVLEAWTVPIASKMGPVSDGLLRVRSRLCRVQLGWNDFAEHGAGQIMHFDVGNLEDDYDFVFPDIAEEPLTDVYCLEVTVAEADLTEEEMSMLHCRGLLLQPTGTGQFRRVGMYHLLGAFACELIGNAYEKAHIDCYEDVSDGKYTISIR